MLRALVGFLLALMLAGCLSMGEVRATFEPYVGKHFDEAVMRFGVPTGCYDMRDGKRLCEWKRSWYSTDVNGMGNTFRKRFAMTMGPSGIIDGWSWSGPTGIGATP